MRKCTDKRLLVLPLLCRGTSLIKKRALLGLYSRTMLRALWGSYGWAAFSYERGTPVLQSHDATLTSLEHFKAHHTSRGLQPRHPWGLGPSHDTQLVWCDDPTIVLRRHASDMAAPFKGLDARGTFQSVKRGPSREEERSLLRRPAWAGIRSGPRGGASWSPWK